MLIVRLRLLWECSRVTGKSETYPVVLEKHRCLRDRVGESF
jgi:hypothetical protein